MKEYVPVSWIGYALLLLSLTAYANTLLNLIWVPKDDNDPVVTRLHRMWSYVNRGSLVIALVTAFMLVIYGYGKGAFLVTLIGLTTGGHWKQVFRKIESYSSKGFKEDVRSWISLNRRSDRSDRN